VQARALYLATSTFEDVHGAKEIRLIRSACALVVYERLLQAADRAAAGLQRVTAAAWPNDAGAGLPSLARAACWIAGRTEAVSAARNLFARGGTH
jgi:hypothetical protein